MNSPLRIGIIGMSGFAADHHDRVKTLERTGEARLIATCDPRAAELCDDDAPFQLRQRGVRIFSNYREMIDAASRNNQDYLTVTGLSDALRAFSDRGQWPASFGGERVMPPRSIDRSELSRFHDTIAHLSTSPRAQAQSACAV